MEPGTRRSTRNKQNCDAGNPDDSVNKTAGSAKKSFTKAPGYERQFKRKKVDVAKGEASPLGYPSAPVAGNMLVGAHVSAAGGLHNSVENALKIGCRSFALFVRNQRTWKIKPLEEDEVALFRKTLDESKFPPHQIVPHGSYLLNCGSSDESTFAKSKDTLLEEVKRCEALGLSLYNFHPGSTCGVITISECIANIALCVNEALQKTRGVTILLENMSRQGNTIGGDFQELRAIIDLVEDQSRIGICFDTCHAFAAGYDLSTPEGFDSTMKELERIVGLKYLKAVHLNDSKGDIGCRKDRHEDIGKGKIGLPGFQFLMKDSRFAGIPMVLETPGFNDYSTQIDLLNSLV